MVVSSGRVVVGGEGLEVEWMGFDYRRRGDIMGIDGGCTESRSPILRFFKAWTEKVWVLRKKGVQIEAPKPKALKVEPFFPFFFPL